MDAGIMDGSSLLFGAVGAVPGIKNPILVAKLMVDEQRKGLLPLGRVPPGFLVGEGAREWAVRHGVPTVTQDKLVSDKSRKLFRHYKKKLDTYMLKTTSAATGVNANGNGNNKEHSAQKRLRRSDDDDDDSNESANGGDVVANGGTKHHRLVEDDRVTDTVGVVVMDRQGRVASTVSSGGIALKQPGRVGQASCFGCGCWAQSNMGQRGGLSVAISTTGCGEHLVRTFLARECATSLGSDGDRPPIVVLRNVMKEKFAESPFLQGIPEKLGGAICMLFDEKGGRGEFLWTHTTASMGVAYMTTADAKATTVMSRLPPRPQQQRQQGETTILVEGVPFRMVSVDAPATTTTAGAASQSSSSASSSAASSETSSPPPSQMSMIS